MHWPSSYHGLQTSLPIPTGDKPITPRWQNGVDARIWASPVVISFEFCCHVAATKFNFCCCCCCNVLVWVFVSSEPAAAAGNDSCRNPRTNSFCANSASSQLCPRDCGCAAETCPKQSPAINPEPVLSIANPAWSLPVSGVAACRLLPGDEYCSWSVEVDLDASVEQNSAGDSCRLATFCSEFVKRCERNSATRREHSTNPAT